MKVLILDDVRSVQKANYNVAGVNGSKASAKGKAKKSPTRIQRVFRRVQSKPDSLEILGTSPGSNGSGSGAGAGALFAQQLTKICSGDQLPQPIIDMLVELRNKGPFPHLFFLVQLVTVSNCYSFSCELIK